MSLIVVDRCGQSVHFKCVLSFVACRPSSNSPPRASRRIAPSNDQLPQTSGRPLSSPPILSAFTQAEEYAVDNSINTSLDSSIEQYPITGMSH